MLNMIPMEILKNNETLQEHVLNKGITAAMKWFFLLLNTPYKYFYIILNKLIYNLFCF